MWADIQANVRKYSCDRLRLYLMDACIIHRARQQLGTLDQRVDVNKPHVRLLNADGSGLFRGVGNLKLLGAWAADLLQYCPPYGPCWYRIRTSAAWRTQECARTQKCGYQTDIFRMVVLTSKTMGTCVCLFVALRHCNSCFLAKHHISFGSNACGGLSVNMAVLKRAVHRISIT